MQNKLICFTISVFLVSTSSGLFAQEKGGVAINTDGAAPNKNAMLQVDSPQTGAGKGLIVPRVSENQRTQASLGLAGGLLDDSGNLRGGEPAPSLLLFQMDGTKPGFYVNVSATVTPDWKYLGPELSADDIPFLPIGKISGLQPALDGKQDVISALVPDKVMVTDGSGNISASTVAATQLSYLNGVASNIQTQINGKQDTLSGLGADKALVTDPSGSITASTTTASQLSYLNGVTSNIQTQLDGKQEDISGLTPNRALTSDAGGNISTSTVPLNKLDALGALAGSDKAVYIDTNGLLSESLITKVELENLGGTTGNIQTQLNATVKKTGDETVAGIKTFSAFPITPSTAPTTDFQTANKKYVDDTVSSAVSGSGFTWNVETGTSASAVANNGYVANNPAIVTINLPSAPDVGSVVRVSGAGAGGWKLVPPAGTGIYVGKINAGWETEKIVNSSKDWSGVGINIDGSKRIACAQLAAGSDYIYLSTDYGTTWVSQAGPGLDTWTDIDMSSNGQAFACNSSIGFAWHYDGAAWNMVGIAADEYKSVAIADPDANGNRMAAINLNSTLYEFYVFVDTDADSVRDTWKIEGSSNTAFYDVSISRNGKFIAFCGVGSIKIYDYDNQTWLTDPAGLPSVPFVGISISDDGQIIAACATVAASGEYVYVSTDGGTSFAQKQVLGPGVKAEWTGVAMSADGSTIMACAPGEYLYKSSDSGATWTNNFCGAPINKSWQCLAITPNGSWALAGSAADFVYTGYVAEKIESSGSIKGDQYEALELQFIGNNTYMPLSGTGEWEFQ